jgi:hypothetical protein
VNSNQKQVDSPTERLATATRRCRKQSDSSADETSKAQQQLEINKKEQVYRSGGFAFANTMSTTADVPVSLSVDSSAVH